MARSFLPPILLHVRTATRTWLGRALGLRTVVAWGLLLWLTLVAVPYAFLFPDDGLDRPICLVLAGLAPAGVLVAVGLGEATIVLGAALAGLVPVLVAVPALHGVRTSGGAQGVWLALVLLGLLRAAWNHDAVHTQEADLRRLVRWPPPGPQRWQDGATLVLGLAGLGLAWHVGPLPAERVEAARAARVAAVLLLWLAVRLVPLRGATPGLDATGSLGDRWPLWLGRRLSWVGLLGGLWWMWK